MPGPHCSHEVSGIPLNNLEVRGKISYGSSMKRIPAWPHTKHIFLPDFHSETFSKSPYLPPHWWGGGTIATGYLTFSANRVGAAVLQQPSTVEVRGFIVLSWSPAKCFISQTFPLNPFVRQSGEKRLDFQGEIRDLETKPERNTSHYKEGN